MNWQQTGTSSSRGPGTTTVLITAILLSAVWFSEARCEERTLGMALLEALATSSTAQASAINQQTLGGFATALKELSPDEAKAAITMLAFTYAQAGETKGEADEATAGFRGFGFGGGVAVSFLFGSATQVEDATVVNGTVRITESKTAFPRLLLESHYLLTKAGHPLIGHGPFVAISSSDDKVLDSFGLGWMIGLRRQADKSESLNLGLGIIFDPSVKQLGGDIEDGDPLPSGENSIRFRTASAAGPLILASFSF